MRPRFGFTGEPGGIGFIRRAFVQSFWNAKVALFRNTNWRKIAMPAYEYQCTLCGHRFERRQKMSDTPISDCPECRGQVKRLISGGAGAISKGSGASVPDAGPSCGPGGCCGAGNACCGVGCDD